MEIKGVSITAGISGSSAMTSFIATTDLMQAIGAWVAVLSGIVAIVLGLLKLRDYLHGKR